MDKWKWVQIGPQGFLLLQGDLKVELVLCFYHSVLLHQQIMNDGGPDEEGTCFKWEKLVLIA